MDNQVSLLTYNIFMRPYFIKNNADDHKETRLKLLLHFFKDFDIVCIQEIFDVFTHRRQKLLRRAAKIGFRYFAQAEAPGLFEPFLIDGGLLILSKYPIEQTIFHAFEVGVHSDALTKKGVLFVRIKLPLGYLNLFTTHTQASYIETNKEDEIPSFLMRLKQLISARRFIEKTLSAIASEKDLNLFVGDLNVNANEKNYPIDRVLQQFESGQSIRTSLNQENPNEYDLLMYIFNQTGGNFCFSDCMYEQHNTFKVTYGDCLVNEDQPLVGSQGTRADQSQRPPQHAVSGLHPQSLESPPTGQGNLPDRKKFD
jgi:endonuclease/exonuclease/phosphatase family metal-dependent hydrolase